MCGISGFVSKNHLVSELERSLNSIAHRGPDSRGVMSWTVKDSRVGLGHVRLSIIDLSPSGAQPMISTDGRFAMVFNGEIFNHGELREGLRHIKFKGKSDSEVLLEHFVETGVSGFAALRGMFSAAFMNLETGELTIVRDQIGVKPIYYHTTKNEIFFSSEIKGLLAFMKNTPQVCKQDLYEFLSCGFVYEPNTGFEDVKKIPPGCYIQFKDGNSSLHRYFDLEKASWSAKYSDELLKSAISRQLESDVKLGVFYSGGIDSTILSLYAQKPALFAKYDTKESERAGIVSDEPYADAIAEKLSLQMSKLRIDANEEDADSIIREMQAVASGTEEPISDFTFLASQRLSAAARSMGYKVMLSGMGGDEVFVGYPRYRMLGGEIILKMAGKLLHINPLRLIISKIPMLSKKVDRFIEFHRESIPTLKYTRLIGYFSKKEIIDFIGCEQYAEQTEIFIKRLEGCLKGFEKDHAVIQGMVLDYSGFLSHNLMVADKSSMREGLELRVPLLDQDLYCAFLGALRKGEHPIVYGKRPLSDILLKHLPSKLVHRKKTGFNPPIDSRISILGESRILTIMRDGYISQYLNLNEVEAMVHRHFSGVQNNSYKIWQLLYLKFWLDIWYAA